MIKYLLFFLTISILSFGQQQIGQTIGLNPQEKVIAPTLAISENGNIIAVGDSYYDTNGLEKAGRVKVYRNLTGVWSQIGQDLEGKFDFNYFGKDISLSADGKVLAISAKSPPNQQGHYVQIYRNLLGTWTQVGNNLSGVGGIISNRNISLSANGNIIAIGDSDATTTNGAYSGTIKIYQNTSGVWTQIGQDINGKTSNANSGYNVSISANGNIVAFSSRFTNSTIRSNYVSVYYKDNSGSWTQLGNDFYIQNHPRWYGGSSDVSITLSSNEMGVILAIGCPNCSNTNQDSRGLVRVYEYNPSSKWAQIGQDITDPHQLGYFGDFVSLSYDGRRIAISDNNAILNGQPNDGYAQVYENNSNTWTKIASKITCPGNEQFSYAVISGDGNYLGVALSEYSVIPGSVITNAYVHVYDLTKPASTNQFILDNFNIFPNPATDVLNITLDNELILKKIMMYNNLGKIVKETKDITIDVSNLAKGIYFVEVQTNQGEVVKKVVLK